MTASAEAVHLSDGLTWRNVDLHVHTPASHDYVGPQVSPTDFIKQVAERGIDLIAVTDHNTGAWIDRLKIAAEGTSVSVVPAVEVSVSGGKGGVHLIALFDLAVDSRKIDELLVKLDIQPTQFGKVDAVSPKSVEDAIKTIARAGGLAILAHADSSKGVLSDMRGEQRTRVMNLPDLAAVEVKDIVTHRRLLDGSDANYGRALPVFRASDNRSADGRGHDVAGVGSRYSAFKMDAISLEAIRQCFCDPDVRIRTDLDIPAHPESYPYIEKVEVSQGFLKGVFEFHRGLNCIVGGKGVGKSLLIEFLRFALDQESRVQAIADDVASKLAKQLGLGGSVVVTVRSASGARYAIKRTYDGSDNPATVREISTDSRLNVIGSELAPILAYSQTEAIEIARNPSAQLELIDTFIDKGDHERRKSEVRKALHENDLAVSDALRALETAREYEQEVATLQAKVKELDELLKSNEHTKLEDAESVSGWLDDLSSDWSAVLETVTEATEMVGDQELSDPAEYELPADAPRDVRTSLMAARRDVVRDLKEVVKKVSEAQKELVKAQRKQNKILDGRRTAYDNWASRAGGERADVARKHAAMKKRLTRHKKLLKVERDKGKGLNQLLAARKKHLDKLDAIRMEIYELRRGKYQSLEQASRNRLHLQVQRDANRIGFVERLVTLRRGTRLRERQLGKVAKAVTPRELIDYVLAEDVDELAHATNLDQEHAQKIVDMLLAPEHLAEALALQHDELIEDVPLVELKKEGGAFQPIAELSVGQKCTALMIIALAEGDRPVVIDQPEDALDIPTIYEDVTRQLRDRKESRQFILTTHNPTVAVAGDADKYHVIRASANSGKLTVAGGLDQPNVKREVIQHLEGGRRPLELKRHKYGDAS